MTDIVERLRRPEDYYSLKQPARPYELMKGAADEIEQLRGSIHVLVKENARLQLKLSDACVDLQERKPEMTMPHLMNCSHTEEGWCLDCVKREHDENERVISELTRQLEAFRQREKELAAKDRKLRDAIDEWVGEDGDD